MSVITTNGSSNPMPLYGLAVQTGNYIGGPYSSTYYGTYRIATAVAHDVSSISTLNQVVGLVPVFPCVATECRLGKYGANDSAFMLPVFAENQLATWGDYKNDYNSFLFDVPALSGLVNLTYYLDRYISGAWVQQAILSDNTYGFFYPVGKLCNKNYFTGYNILWNKVLNVFGEGIYRFRVGSSTGSFTNSTNHFAITGLKPNSIATVELLTTGYGLICPTFTVDTAASFDVNMIALTAFINTYQATVSPVPLFHATFNAGTHTIDLVGLLGQNCPCTALVTNVTYTSYASSFTGGSDTLTVLACYASPPFCLKTWDCWAVDQTSRFDAFYSGGVIGNVDKSQPGSTWSFCCSGRPVVYPDKTSLLTIRVWANSHVGTNFTFNFTMDGGYDLVPAIPITAGMTYITIMTTIANAINTYQATLTPPQFSAYYNPTLKLVEITNLFGQNIGFSLAGNWAGTGTNTVQLTFNPAGTYSGSGGGYTQNFRGSFAGGTNLSASSNSSNAIAWQDAIRVGGEFGYENTDYERKSIKYQTGVVNKIRDEAILKHTWKSSSLPFWFHERFKVYGLMADKLLASDYNMNNSDYGIKLYSVQGDSSYNPDWKNYPRETMVKCEFKPAVQNLKRNRCC